MNSFKSKLIKKKGLVAIRDKRIVLAHGCYDLLTWAHMRHLAWAKRHGDVLVVSVTSDAHVARHKGEGRPHFSHHRRAEQLAGLEAVDYVVICRANSALPIIEMLRPDIYVKGSDTIENPSDSFQKECDFVKSYGGQILFSPSEEEAHTSTVRAKLLSHS